MDQDKSAIRVNRLTKVFGSQLVLDQLELQVAAGQAVALMGANGSGKTTLLRCLATAIRPTSGEVFWFGQSAGSDSATRRLVGMLGHESTLYPNLTARENLLFAARMCDVSQPAHRVDEWITSAGIQTHAHRPVAKISKGMRQRVAILRAVVHDPQILLLDEPFSGLDGEGTDWLKRLLDNLRNRQRAICFAMHDQTQAAESADRILWLRSGTLHECPL